MKQKNVQLEALIDSKKEYLDHLFDLMTEPIVVTFQDMYQHCLESPETRKKGILTAFQDALVSVSAWNHHLIQEHYQKIVAHTGCKYIPELVRALISVQVKINLIANTLSTSSNIKLRIPNAENFVHRCYVDVARAVWKRPYLLYHNVRSVEKQQNLLDLEKIIHQSIRTTIRGYVPMEQLIAQSQMMDIPIDNASSDDDTESESETESESDDESVIESESETESDTDVESIVEVVELPSEPEVEEKELQNEVIAVAMEPPTDHATIDITTVHEEPEEECVDETDVTIVHEKHDDIEVTESESEEPSNEPVSAPVLDNFEVYMNQQTEFRKSVELKNEELEDDDGEVHIDKMPELEVHQNVVEPIVETNNSSEDKAVPFQMMLMNRKIIHHRPPPSMVIKKKKKDAFF